MTYKSPATKFVFFRPINSRSWIGRFQSPSLSFLHVVFKLCVSNTFKVVGHRKNAINIKNRKEYEPCFYDLQKTANTLIERKLLHRWHEYGDVLRAGRRKGDAERTNVAMDVAWLIRNCRSWYRPIDLQAQNSEGNGYKCERIAQQTVQATSLSSSAWHAREAEGRKKNCARSDSPWLPATLLQASVHMFQFWAVALFLLY